MPEKAGGTRTQWQVRQAVCTSASEQWETNGLA